MMYRLPAIEGEWIDRQRPLSFTFEGRHYEGFAGDTITSALAAAGVMILGRSFKYHRPRGIVSFANHDVNALFQVSDVPNVRGDVVVLREGMDVTAVNTIGGLAEDSARWMDKLARFLPVGFYYKAFHSKRLFPRWEKLIRAFSGLGRIDFASPHVRTPKRYAFCDVLVIGAGISGMKAALAAARLDVTVLLVDEAPHLGGSARSQDVDTVMAELRERANVAILTSTAAVGCYADGWIALIERDRMTKLRAQSIVLATGAIEQPFVFRNNDLPGILLASAALRLLRRHAIAVGRRVVIATCDSSGYATASELLDHGVAVVYLIDVRANVDADSVTALEARGPTVLRHAVVREAHADTSGVLEAISVASGASVNRIECDALLMAGSWTPALQLLLQAGGKSMFEEAAQMHLASEVPSGFFIAGRAAGVFDLHGKGANASLIGVQAASFARAGVSALSAHRVEHTSRHLGALQATLGGNVTPPIQSHPKGKDFVDFDEDLQVKDLVNAVHEGFDSIELMKRYTTVGMGPSQGKLSNSNAARILASARDLPIGAVGLTTARPMYHPVPMKHLAGRGFTPERATPIASRHRELQAVWMLAGNWRRPEYYARDGETRDKSIAAEVHAVRNSVGLIDVGTLGKIEVHGPDAGEFLDRAYAGRYSDLKVGMTRYALLLDEAGTIVDDGVVARLNPQSFYFTTTSGGSAGVYRELLRLNALWRLNCSLVNVTGHRAAFNLAGPHCRELLSRLTTANLSESAFQYLSVREATLANTAVRLMRVGFVGELGFEIHVPFSHGLAVWDSLVKTGEDFGLRVFGVEAQRVLRLEKGHFIVGQDTDGLTNPFEAQASWAVKMNKPFFMGQRSLRILEKRGPRQLLVGFELVERVPALKECHLVVAGSDIVGRVTSVAYSHTLSKTIGLAMVRPSLATMGTKLSMRLGDGKLLTATVVPTPFYDRDNRRQRLEVAA
jgi:sarcosine oxidase, subunit alpha